MSGRRVPEGNQPAFRLFDRVRVAWGYPELPVIVADAIAEQIDRLPDKENYSPPASEYGIVAPPFKKCFIEATTHAYAQCWLNPRTILPESYTQRGVALYDASDDPLAEALITAEHRRTRPAGTRWTLALFGYIWTSVTRELLTFPGPAFVHLDEKGRILDDMSKLYIYEAALRRRDISLMLVPPDLPEGWRYEKAPLPAEALPNLVPFALKAVSAMHRRCEAEKVEPSRQARRQAEKHERMTLNSYYVLKVKPTPIHDLADFKRIGTPAATERREHRVRGHFRYYYPERPLLGKYSGAIWVDEHDRGKNTYGSIRKDYEVKE